MLIAVQQAKIKQLTDATPFAEIGAPEHNVLETMEEDLAPHDFWENFATFSPILMCYAADKDKKTSSVRDNMVTGEILKTLSVLNILA